MIAGLKASSAINIAGAAVAVGLVSILAFMTWALVFVTIPSQNKDALGLLIGVLSSNVALVVGFFFGSSASARQQQATIDTLANAAQASTSPATMTIPSGESATVTATQGGTEIKPEHPAPAPKEAP